MVRAFTNPQKIKIHFFTVNFKFSKSSPKLIFPFSGGGGGGRRGGLVETNFQLLMLSPNLLKSKKKKITRGFAEIFLSFQAKKFLGMVLDFEYQVARVFLVYANHNNEIKMFKMKIQIDAGNSALSEFFSHVIFIKYLALSDSGCGNDAIFGEKKMRAFREMRHQSENFLHKRLKSFKQIRNIANIKKSLRYALEKIIS